MIETKTCFVPVCDGCGARDNEDYEVHHPTDLDARARAVEMEWTPEGDKLFCGRCRCYETTDGQHTYENVEPPVAPRVPGSVWRRCTACGSGTVIRPDETTAP